MRPLILCVICKIMHATFLYTELTMAQLIILVTALFINVVLHVGYIPACLHMHVRTLENKILDPFQKSYS